MPTLGWAIAAALEVARPPQAAAFDVAALANKFRFEAPIE